MDLHEALEASPVERVIRIAQFYGIQQPSQKDKDPRYALSRLIAEHLLVPANTVVAMNGLDDEEILALRLITLATGGSGVVVEQCHQKLNHLSRKWRRNGFKVIEGLIERGLVFIRREGYRQIYFVPRDLRKVLSEFFLSKIFKECAWEQSRFNPRHLRDFAAPLRHLCLFLSYIRKNDVRVTQAGTMFKKAQNDISVLIEESDTATDETIFPVRYSPRLAFLIYFAKSKGLIEERNGALRPGNKVKSFLEASYQEWRQELYEYWKQTFIAQDTDLQTMLWILMHLPKGELISISALTQEMETLSTNYSSHGLNLRVERNLVDMLEYLGALEVATSLNDTIVRVTDIGRALFKSDPWPDEPFEDSIYVQSNFEILVPCTVQPRILWSIDTFAELLKPDQMMVYKITRDSVYRALLHDYTPEVIEEFLNKTAKNPIPQNVIYSIRHWGTSFGRIEFQDVILLKCDTQELAGELMVHPKIRPFLAERIGPYHLVVKRDSYESLIEALSDEGYMPKVAPGKGLTPGVVSQT